jgi:hypothetical protein
LKKNHQENCTLKEYFILHSSAPVLRIKRMVLVRKEKHPVVRQEEYPVVKQEEYTIRADLAKKQQSVDDHLRICLSTLIDT